MCKTLNLISEKFFKVYTVMCLYECFKSNVGIIFVWDVEKSYSIIEQNCN